MRTHSESAPLITSRHRASLAKLLLLKLLSKLEHGCLRVYDGDQVYEFGDSDASLQAHLRVKDQAFYSKALFQGTVGAGESYMAAQWESDTLTPLIQLLVRNTALLDRIDHVISAPTQWARRLTNTLRRNSPAGSKRNISAHYDLGNDFYTLFLDRSMAYSCAVFTDQDQSLYQAQINKFDLICQRLELKPGETLLEIGTGWGGLAIHAAQHYGAQVTTTTISAEQYNYTAKKIKSLDLQDQITLLQKDYRELEGRFDKLVSVEMLEAVGHQYLTTYFKKIESLLRPGGTLLLQSITISDQRFERYLHQVDFIQQYIFPGGFLPSINALSNCTKKHTHLQITGLHDIGPHYATTLRYWSERLQRGKSDPEVSGRGEPFYRLWQFYFHYCEGGFLERSISTVHLTARKPDFGTCDA